MPKKKLPPLREIRFGDLDASQEAASTPDLLKAGYFDYREAAYSIAARGAWLLLGPKGAGKSAVLEHLRLLWVDRWGRFMTYWNLESFPIQDVTRIGLDRGRAGQRAQAAWTFLLLMKVAESISADEGRGNSTKLDEVLRALRRRGYISSDADTLVRRLAGTTIGLDLKILKGAVSWEEEAKALPDLSKELSQGLSEVRTESQHLVALDGLDSFFFEGGAGWESLSGLIDAIAATNRLLTEANLPASVVATLRSDHFDALNSQNSNKLKDYTVYLDWSSGGIGTKNHLWSLVTQKGSVFRPEVQDLVKQYLSNPMDRPSFPSVAEFLLSYTRLLPRDVVSIMKYVQDAHPGSTPVIEEHAVEAARRYSEEYFVGEVMNNLAGVLISEKAHKMIDFRDALRTAPTRYFDFKFLVEELKDELEPTDIKALLRRMFEIGAIGISNPLGSGPRYTDFIFRKVSGAAFTHRYEFVLHDALTRAWNRPWH